MKISHTYTNELKQQTQVGNNNLASLGRYRSSEISILIRLACIKHMKYFGNCLH